MLDPHERVSLFEALRPPPGYEFDAAVGTSFTLDLEALLTVPIAFTLLKEDDGPDEGGEPVGLLEAIRRHASHITLFCQAGQIAVPRQRSVLAWLEGAVVPIPAPRPRHLFHPKFWVTRFKEVGGDHLFLRVLCATRNLTFDMSWDTLLKLESKPYQSPPKSEVSGQLSVAAFLRRLPGMTTMPVEADRVSEIRSLALDVARVPLALPEGFADMKLHVLGVAGLESSPLPVDRHDVAIVSPFLSARFLERISTAHNVRLLASREESLDRIPAEVLAKITRLAVLNPAVDIGDTEGADSEEGGATESADPSVPLSGLHAKLFVFDGAGGTRVLTGSANASEAAFGGNIEVVAELESTVPDLLESLLTPSPGDPGIADLLIDYETPEATTPESEQEQLELSLDELRRRIAEMSFEAELVDTEDQFEMKVSSGEPVPSMEADELEISIWPVSLAEDQSSLPLAPGEPAEVSFNVTLEGVTAFFAIRVTARKDSARATTTFTVTALLEGAPENRHSRLLAAMLRDPSRLLRFLLLLLSDAEALAWGDGARGAEAWFSRWASGAPDEAPILELLVRAVDRYPDRLDHIDALLRDLADNESDVMPHGFRDIWEPIWAARERSLTR